MPLVLHGYRYSVYVRIVRLALAEKGVAYERVEVNPFAPDVPAAYLALHPFGRVPTLVHDDFALYETGAITRYLDRAFAGPALQPRRRAPWPAWTRSSAWSIPTATGRWCVRSSRIASSGRRIGQPADEAEVGAGSRRRRQGPGRARGAGGARRLPRRARLSRSPTFISAR